MTKSDAVRKFAKDEYIEPARRRHDTTVRVVAGDVQRALKLQNRTPLICSALKSRKFLDENHLILEKLEGPPGGMSTTVTFTYRLDSGVSSEAPEEDLFERLKGSMQETFASLGGGEAFLRRQRKYFYEPEPEEPEK